MAYTEEQLALKVYLEERNAKSKAYYEANGYTFYTLPSEDLDHWVKYGVNNIAQFEHQMAAGTHSDMTKELHGSRVRYPYSEMSTEDINEDIDRMGKMLKDREKELEAMEEQEAKKLLERKKANKYQGNFAFAALRDMK